MNRNVVTWPGRWNWKKAKILSPVRQAPAPSLGLLHQWLHSLLRLLHSHNIERQLLRSPEKLVFNISQDLKKMLIITCAAAYCSAAKSRSMTTEGLTGDLFHTTGVWAKVPDLDSDKRLVNNDGLLVKVPTSIYCIHKLASFWKLQKLVFLVSWAWAALARLAGSWSRLSAQKLKRWRRRLRY